MAPSAAKDAAAATILLLAARWRVPAGAGGRGRRTTGSEPSDPLSDCPTPGGLGGATADDCEGFQWVGAWVGS